MGWFKKIFGFSSQDLGDKFTPESMKDMGGPDWLNPLRTKASDAASVVTTPKVEAPGIVPEEAESLSAKRLARLGRYFTSPLGVLNSAATGSQKVFS